MVNDLAALSGVGVWAGSRLYGTTYSQPIDHTTSAQSPAGATIAFIMIPRSTILASSLRHLRVSRRIPSTSPKSLRRSLSQAARPENNGPSSSTHASKPQGISGFGVVVSMAIAAALGYGASTLTKSNAAAAPILDERRLPQVNYASLKDMEKVTSSSKCGQADSANVEDYRLLRRYNPCLATSTASSRQIQTTSSHTAIRNGPQ